MLRYVNCRLPIYAGSKILIYENEDDLNKVFNTRQETGMVVRLSVWLSRNFEEEMDKWGKK